MSETGAERQRTLAGSASLSGRGLHSGLPVVAALHPAPEDTGIRFRRKDLKGEPCVVACVANVGGVAWETALTDEGTDVRTVEHVLAALAGSGIDNAEVRLEGPEPPALDGSAEGWCELIDRIGTVEQAADARVIAVQTPFILAEGDSRYAVTPYAGYRVSAEIEFDNAAIGRQFASCHVDGGAFRDELAPARTFGLEIWREKLHGLGLALGASPENTIVLTEQGLGPDTELRFTDEFARHKILDIIGDLALTGARIRAHVVAERPSHRGNVALARRLARLLARPADGSPVLDIQKILEYIPHRYPFLLIDRIIEFEVGKRIVGLKNVTINEPFFVGHFPGHPIMPGVLIIEAMAQIGGLLLMNEFDDPKSKVVYFMSMDAVKFRRPVTPGDQLIFELEMIQFRGRVCRMKGVGTVDGQTVAEAEMMARVVDR